MRPHTGWDISNDRGEALELGTDFFDLAAAVLLDEQSQHVAHEGVGVPDDGVDDGCLRLLVELRVAKDLAQLGHLSRRLDEVAELLPDLSDAPGLLCGREQRLAGEGRIDLRMLHEGLPQLGLFLQPIFIASHASAASAHAVNIRVLDARLRAASLVPVSPLVAATASPPAGQVWRRGRIHNGAPRYAVIRRIGDVAHLGYLVSDL